MNFEPLQLQSGNNYGRLLKLTSPLATLFGYKHKKFGPNRTRINGVCHWHDRFGGNQWKTLKMAIFSPPQSRNNWVRLFKFMSALAPLSEYMYRSFERNRTKISGANWLETDIEKSSILNFHPGRLFLWTSELPSPAILKLGSWNSP